MSIQYVIDDQGAPVQVLLDIAEYKELLERVKDIEALAALEGIKRVKREPISFEDLLSNLGARH